MAGFLDSYELAPVVPAQAPPQEGNWLDAYPLAPSQGPREAVGTLEHLQAGLQGSVVGMLWRGKLPDLIMNPEHAKWWERAATGIGAIAPDIVPIMMPAGAIGTARGAAIGGAAGTAIGGPPGTAVGAAVGGVVGGGAAMFGAEDGIRQALIEAYKSGEVKTSADWWNIVREVAGATAKGMLVGGVTMGAGATAARVAGKAIAPGIGTTLSVPAATKVIGTADVAAQIAGMTTMPAALHGRLPDFQEFMDAAVVIGALKGAHMTADRVMSTYAKTGRTPAQQVADIQENPDVSRSTLPETPVPIKIDRLIAEATRLADPFEPPNIKNLFAAAAQEGRIEPQQGATVLDALTRRASQEWQIQDAPNIRDVINEIKKAGPVQKDLLAEVDGLKVFADKVDGKSSLNDAERAELVDLRARVERAAKLPEESAQRVHEDVLRQVREADQARKDAGIQPLGEDHAAAVAALVRARVRTRAARLGKLPEEIYAERPLQIRDEAQAEAVAAEEAVPAGAVRYPVPEVDMFGAPAPMVPRLAVEGIATIEAPLDQLVLSKEVPQFKAQANDEGIITPLGGAFDRTGVGPIQVWERLDGTLEVISGRHRLDLARRSGEKTIPAQIHRESEGFTARQAASLDAELNIREEQGSVADYAQYFASAGVSKEAAESTGLLARAKGRAGFAIARDGAEDLRASHSAGLLSDEAALSISLAAPGDARLQSLGMSVVMDGKSILFATNMMKSVSVMAADRKAAGAQGDIFGFDDSAMVEAETMAKKAGQRQRAIAEQIASVSGASKRPEIARKLGVDVADPGAVKLKIVELRQEQYQWDNWPLYPELVARLKELEQGPSDEFSLVGETPSELKARDEEAAAAAKRKLDQERVAERLAQGKPVKADQLDLFNTQNTLFQGIKSEPIGEMQKRLEDKHPDVALHLSDHPNGVIQLDLIEVRKDENTGKGLAPKAMRDLIATADEQKRGIWLLAATLKPDKMPQEKLEAWYESFGFEKQPTEFSNATWMFREPRVTARADRPQEDTRSGGKGDEAVDTGSQVSGTGEAALDTLYQPHRGAFDVAENLIRTFAGADKSTVVHELSHSWLEELKLDASRPDAPEQLKADWELVRRELAIPASGEISRASHEQWARTGERYLGEGKAPTPELQGVFERFKTWLLEIYNDLRNLNVEINPELRGILDRLLATDEEIAAARELNVPREYVAEAKATEARKIVPGFKAEQVSMQPFADELPKGPGEAPDNTHVNYAFINSPLDVKLTMQRMAEIDQENIQKQRGGIEGVKSWADANAEQAKYVNDILGGSEDTLKLLSPRDSNAAGPDVKLGILKKLAVGAAKDSARLRDVVLEAGHDATVRQQLEYMGSIERARMIQAEFLGERAAVARALNALKDVTEGSGEIGRMLEAIGTGELYQTARTPAQEQAFLKAQLDLIMQNYRGRSPLDIARLHKEIGTLKGTFKLAKGVTEATKWEMVVEAWKSSLLSGPVTHTTNLFGTGAFMALRAPVDLLSSVIGMARGASVGMGETDRASMSEAVARITGMLGGVQDGLKVAYATFRADDPTGKTEAYRTAIPGRAGEIIRTPLRLMRAEDALVTTMYKRGEMKTLTIRQAFDENMNPGTREFAERVDSLMDHPTPAMELASDAAATRMSFNMPLGEKGVSLQLFVNKWNLQWMIPFIRTPINIAKEMLKMSPLAPVVGEWRTAVAKGGIERDRALAEMALGTGIMAVTMAYAFSDQVSGAGSPDQGKNRGKAGVRQPYSVLIGDTWYEYSRIQPLGTLMGMAADAAEVWDHMTEEERDKVPKMLSKAFANAITNQTFLQGITNVVNGLSDPNRYGSPFVRQLAASVVPNIIAQPTAMMDPYAREVNSVLEAIQARLPGRQDLLPKRDWLGEPEKAKERLGVVLPVREQKVSEDKVRLEAARLDISMSAAPKKMHIGKGTGKIGDIELTPEERDKFEQIGGEMSHRILSNVVNQPSWEQMPDLVKRNVFRKIITASHKYAAVQALPMDKRLAYIQEITEKLTAELQPVE